MTQPEPVQALVFDFDGTIIDTETPVFESWQLTYATAGVEPIDPQAWAAQIGQSSGNSLDLRALLAERLGLDHVPQELEDLRKVTVRSMLDEQPVRAGVTEWIAAAEERGVVLAVASSSGTDWVDMNLRERDMRDHFAVLSCADPANGIPGKPDPTVYVQACALLGVSVDHALAIEDSPNGVRAARAAGLRCIAVPGPVTASANFSHATIRAESLADLDPTDWLG